MEIVERLAELAVDCGANLQQGQTLVVATEIGQEPLARQIAKSAYLKGARYVEVLYFDHEIKRTRLEYAAQETLSYVPEWQSERFEQMTDMECAYIISYTPQLGLMHGVDLERLSRDATPRLAAQMPMINSRAVNWTYVAGASARWAAGLYPELEPEAAMESLWLDVAAMYRLDADDPSREWRRRLEELEGQADRLRGSNSMKGPGSR